MPYDVSKTKDGYVVKKKGTGEVVARPKDKAGLKGFLYHATKGEGEHLSFKKYLDEDWNKKIKAGSVIHKLASVKTDGKKFIGVLKTGKEIPIPQDVADAFEAHKRGLGRPR